MAVGGAERAVLQVGELGEGGALAAVALGHDGAAALLGAAGLVALELFDLAQGLGQPRVLARGLGVAAPRGGGARGP